jgi:hypothetical protein
LGVEGDQYPAGYYYRIDVKTAQGNGNNGLYKAKTSKLQYHFLELSTGKDQAYVWTRGSESLHAVSPPPPPDVLEEGANGTEQLYNQHPLIFVASLLASCMLLLSFPFLNNSCQGYGGNLIS